MKLEMLDFEEKLKIYKTIFIFLNYAAHLQTTNNVIMKLKASLGLKEHQIKLEF